MYAGFYIGNSDFYFVLFQMSRATKRKHVLLEVLRDDFSPPNENQQIVRVLSSRGNNLHEVQSSDNSVFLVSMPTKFRRNVWVRRGDYVLVEPISEGDKVKAEIVRILTQKHIKYFKEENVWPFEDSNQELANENTDDDIFINTNKPDFSDQSDTNSSEDASED